MKKMLVLLLASSLLIACLAGSALANPAQMVISPTPISFNPSSIGSSTVNVYDLIDTTAARTISLSTSNSNLQVRVTVKDSSGNSKTSNWISGTTTQVAIASYDPTKQIQHAAQGIDYTIEVQGSASGQITITDQLVTPIQQDPNTITDVCSATPNANVPEFPTVALPVAAVLGLLFVFGRKKADI